MTTTPRFHAALDTVYQAESLGLVSVYFITGRIGRIRLLVGEQNPPAEQVGYVTEGAVSALVRPGEYWTAATSRPGKNYGYECVFTPFS